MFYMIYVSSSTAPLSSDDLMALLEGARKHNASQGITGMLLYKEGNFMQALEGEEGVVRPLFERIQRDPRHSGVVVLLEGELEQRQFPDWSMAFQDLNSAEARSIPGYSEFLNASLVGKEFFADPTRCQKLLLTFKRNIR